MNARARPALGRILGAQELGTSFSDRADVQLAGVGNGQADGLHVGCEGGPQRVPSLRIITGLPQLIEKAFALVAAFEGDHRILDGATHVGHEGLRAR